MWRQVVLLIGSAVLVVGLPAPVLADATVAGLQCVLVVVEIQSSPAPGFPVSSAAVKDGTFVRLRARAPRLRVAEQLQQCGNWLYVNFNVDSLSSGRGYYGSVQLELYRRVVIVDTNQETFGSVWTAGSILTGGRDPQEQILRAIDDLLDKFVAAYYKAGNP